MKNEKEDDFEIDYEEFEIDRNAFFSNTTRKDFKKSVGVYSPDIKLSIVKDHPMFKNKGLFKIVYAKEEKLKKIEDEFQ